MVKFPLLKTQLSIEEKTRYIENLARKMLIKTCPLYSWDEQQEYGFKPSIYPTNFKEKH